MPAKTNKKKSKGAKGKPTKSNAANKDDLSGLDEMLSNEQEMEEAQRLAVQNGTGYIPRTGAENARIGMKGFTQATKNPAMFSEAMGMLGDPSAVKEAEAMMNDPEFKQEMNRYMETLKQNPAFQTAMEEAQRKFQLLLQDPEKMKEAQDKYEALMSSQTSVDGPAVAAAGEAGAGGDAGAAAGAAAASGANEESEAGKAGPEVVSAVEEAEAGKAGPEIVAAPQEAEPIKGEEEGVEGEVETSA